MVTFSPITPEFMKGKYVHFLVDQQFGSAAPLLDLAGSILSFLGRSLLSFLPAIR